MSRTINGREVEVHPLAGSVPVHEYAKTSTVLAAQTNEDGLVMTPEGAMSYGAGDYIVTDNPVTHAWPVKRAVFEATYERVEHGRTLESH